MTYKWVRNLFILSVAAIGVAILAPLYTSKPLAVPKRSEYDNGVVGVDSRRYGKMWLSDENKDGNVEIRTRSQTSFGHPGDVRDIPMTPGLQEAANDAFSTLQDLEYRLESEAIKAENAAKATP